MASKWCPQNGLIHEFSFTISGLISVVCWRVFTMKSLLPIGKQISLILCDLHIMHICMGSLWNAQHVITAWPTYAQEQDNWVQNWIESEIRPMCSMSVTYFMNDCVSVSQLTKFSLDDFTTLSISQISRVWSGPFHWWRGSHPHSGHCTACGWADPYGPSLDWSS